VAALRIPAPARPTRAGDVSGPRPCPARCETGGVITLQQQQAAQHRVLGFLAAREAYAREAGRPSARAFLGDRVAHQDPSQVLTIPAAYAPVEPHGRAVLRASDLYHCLGMDEPPCDHQFPCHPDTRLIEAAAPCVGCGMTWQEYGEHRAEREGDSPA
jgi:hypothetical protein